MVIGFIVTSIEPADDLPADGVFARKDLARDAIADDDDARGVVAVKRREIPAAQQRDAHGGEIVGAAQRPVGFGQLLTLTEYVLADDGVAAIRSILAGWQSHHGRGRLHTRQSRDRREKLV